MPLSVPHGQIPSLLSSGSPGVSQYNTMRCQHKNIPCPMSQTLHDSNLWQGLNTAASTASHLNSGKYRLKVDCTYLGQKMTPDIFEPDPANWNVPEAERKSQALVVCHGSLSSTTTVFCHRQWHTTQSRKISQCLLSPESGRCSLQDSLKILAEYHGSGFQTSDRYKIHFLNLRRFLPILQLPFLWTLSRRFYTPTRFECSRWSSRFGN